MVRRRELLKTAGVAGTIGLTASAGCIGQFGSEPYGDGEIRFLMSPTEPQDQMRAQYTPIKERLNDHIDAVDTVSMKYAADYSATLTALDSGTADIAETGPFAAALGVNTDKAEIILQRHGFGSWEYRSNIVTREDADVESLSDLEGETIAFADPLSASGSLFPLHMLKQAGLSVPDEPGNPSGADFDPQWSSHAAAKEALVNEQAMAAGIGYFMVRGDGQEYEEGIRALKVRKGIPRAPILVSPGLTDDEKQQLTTAFTEAPDSIYLGEDGEADTDDDLWFDAVREADVETYQPVIDVANDLGYGEEIFQQE